MKKKLFFLSLPLLFTMLVSCSGSGGTDSSSESSSGGGSSSGGTSSGAPSELTPEEIVDTIINPENVTMVNSLDMTAKQKEGDYEIISSQTSKNTVKFTPTSVSGDMGNSAYKSVVPIGYIAEQMAVENPTDEQIGAFYEAMKSHLVPPGCISDSYTIDRENNRVEMSYQRPNMAKSYATYDTTAKQWVEIDVQGEEMNATYWTDSDYEKYFLDRFVRSYTKIYEDLLKKGSYNEATKTYLYEPNTNYKIAGSLVKVSSMSLTMKDGLPSVLTIDGIEQDIYYSVEERPQIKVVQEFKDYNSTVINIPQYEIKACNHSKSTIKYEYVDKDYCRSYCGECHRYLAEKSAHHVAGNEEVCCHCGEVVGGVVTHWEALEKAFDSETNALKKSLSNKVYFNSANGYFLPNTSGRETSRYTDTENSKQCDIFYYSNQKILVFSTCGLQATKDEESCVSYNPTTVKLFTNVEMDLSGKTSDEKQEYLNSLVSMTNEQILASFSGAEYKGDYEYITYRVVHHASGANDKVEVIDESHTYHQKTCDVCGMKYEAYIIETNI